jgi:hypothetical protein
MKKRKSQSWWDDPAEAEAIARRTGHDVEKVRASLAGLQRLIQDIQSDRRFRKIEPLGQTAAWRDPPAVQRKRRAAILDRERKALADEFRRRGVRDPVRQAENEVAKRNGFRNGPAFNRWLRRNR